MIKIVEMYILLFFTYSLAGWFMESVGGILNVKKFVNRGFLIGPYCPVYGIGVILVTLLLKKYVNDIFVLFILSLVICGTLEYFTSFIMEKLFNARWWDYSKRRFNINGRICLETLVPFGLAASFIIYYINPFLLNIFSKIPNLLLHIVSTFLEIIFFIDCCISFYIIKNFKDATYENGDNTEEIGAKVKDKTEDVLMKAESDVRLFGRKLKLKELEFQRKAKYTRKRLAENILETPREISARLNSKRQYLINKIEEGKEIVNNQVKLKRIEFELKQKEAKEILNTGFKKTKVEFDNLQKNSIEKFDSKIKNLKQSSDEFTKEVIEKFKQTSKLRSRLIDAFPTLKIKMNEKININDDDKTIK